jgi:hypothetical protein
MPVCAILALYRESAALISRAKCYLAHTREMIICLTCARLHFIRSVKTQALGEGTARHLMGWAETTATTFLLLA